jgi:hypothetical protein
MEGGSVNEEARASVVRLPATSVPAAKAVKASAVTARGVFRLFMTVSQG